MKIKNIILKTILSCLAIQPIYSELEIMTLMGTDENPSPIVKELIESRVMQRIKGIDQSGITKYTENLPEFTRYDHSLGVYALLKRFGASEKECVAGLLHDTSHTVFSHVGDFLFSDSDGDYSYQDSIHLWYLKQQETDQILAKYNLQLDDIDPKKPDFCMLEQSLPDMCADRIEYNFHTAYLWGQICSCEIDRLLENLHYLNGSWYFDDVESARDFAEISLYFTEHLWGNPQNSLSYHFCAEALKIALDTNEITVNEILFGEDYEVLAKLGKSPNEQIQSLMEKCASPFSYMTLCKDGYESFDLFMPVKFRGIDPLVMVNGSLVRLTSVDSEFAEKYSQLKEKISKGHFYKKKHLSYIVNNQIMSRCA